MIRGAAIDGFFTYSKNHFISKTSAGVIHKGFGQNVIFVDTAGTVLGTGGPERHHNQYINLNSSVGYTTGEKIYFYASAGLALSYYIKTQVKLDPVRLDNGVMYPGYVVKQKNLTKWDFSLVGEVGVGFAINEGNSMMLVVGYNHGLLDVGYENNTINPWKNRNLTFQIGLRSHFVKRQSSTTSPEGTEAPPNS